jgi:hypothetical protein
MPKDIKLDSPMPQKSGKNVGKTGGKNNGRIKTYQSVKHEGRST